MPTHPNPGLHHPSNERVLLLGQAAAENGIGLASSRLDSIVLAGQKALHRGALAEEEGLRLAAPKGLDRVLGRTGAGREGSDRGK